MTDADLFFTHTIVGAPQTVLLGERLRLPAPNRTTIEVGWHEGIAQLGDDWREWVLLYRTGYGPLRRSGGRMRLWLERHALVMGVLGLLLCTSGALMWLAMMGWMAWNR